MTHYRLRFLIHRAVQFGFGFTVLVFLLGSSSTFMASLEGLAGERAVKYLPFLIVVTASGSLVLGLFEYLLMPQVSGAVPIQASAAPSNRTRLLIFALLAAGIFAQVLTQVSAPLHWEDHFHLSNILREPLQRFNPLIKTEHHTIASVAAFLSVHAFGMTSLGVKLPAVLYTLIFLGVIVAFCRRQTSLAVGLSVLLALGMNQMAVWYMHSMRGYIPAMMLCMAFFFLFREATRGVPEKQKAFLATFVGLCYLTTLTHLFSTIFTLIGILAFLIWLVMSLPELPQEHRAFGAKLLAVFFLCVLPVYGFVLFFQAMWLERLGDFFKGGFPSIGPSLLHALGISFEWAGRLLLAMLAISLVLRFAKERWTRDFTTWFALITIALFWVVLSVLQIRLVETRFLLPFVVPFLVWTFETIERVPQTLARRTLWSVALIGLVAAPLASRAALYDHLTLATKDYVQFIEKVATTTAPVSQNCYTYAGEPNLVYFSQTLYLGELQNVRTGNCQPTHHVWFLSPENLKPIDTRTALQKRALLEPLFSLDDRFSVSKYSQQTLNETGLP